MDNIDNQPTPIKSEPNTKIFSPKLVFGLLAVVLLVEVIFAIYTLSKPTATPSPKVPQISKSSISVVSIKKEYRVGDLIPVSLIIDTGGKKSVGADAILHFDPKALEASSGGLIKGSAYQDYPIMEIDSENGVVTVSGIESSSDANFSGIGLFTMINFKAKEAGQTTLTLDFTPGNTTDTNIAEPDSSKDILEKVINLNLTIK